MSKMNIFLVCKKYRIQASGIYDSETGKVIVKKGSSISPFLSNSKSFSRGIAPIIKRREKFTDGNCVIEDVEFKSLSTAANFILGRSCAGNRLWKTEQGIRIKDLI